MIKKNKIKIKFNANFNLKKMAVQMKMVNICINKLLFKKMLKNHKWNVNLKKLKWVALMFHVNFIIISNRIHLIKIINYIVNLKRLLKDVQKTIVNTFMLTKKMKYNNLKSERYVFEQGYNLKQLSEIVVVVESGVYYLTGQTILIEST